MDRDRLAAGLCQPAEPPFAAGVVAQSDPVIPPMPGLKLTAIRGAKILESLEAGAVIRLEARVIGRMGNLIQAQTTASVNGKIVMQAELTLSGENAPAS